MLLHGRCHSYAHSNVAWARERGLIVSSYELDAAAVPVRLWGGAPVLLDDAGSWQPHA